ncbi:hybrid sensor histidine kinase/response regulator [Salinibacter grassmerensis]|uniref:hybrid sensor histidine kinase/response regulator n=1 Tax=Salinibacter grassmerensis TaxID=3040353 RepID=UPI0021E70142|nr:PAS domain-containing sensor histidine kinase [Salinibacter grassmerensis]
MPPDSLSDVEKCSTGPLVERPDALKEFVEATPAPVAMLDDDWRIITHSRAWLEVFQNEGDETRNPIALDRIETSGHAAPAREALPAPTDQRTFFEVFADPDDEWRSAFLRSLEEKSSQRGHEQRLSQPDGPTYRMDWEVRPWQTKNGSERGVLLSVIDRTEERHAKGLRRQVDHRFDKLVGTISEGVLLMDDNGVFRDGNEAAQNILGRPLDEIIGSRFDDDIWNGLREDGSPLPNVEFPFWRAYVEREPVQEEVMGVYPPDAPPRWIRVNAQPLFRSGQEAPYAVLVSFDDITDERLKEEALQTSRDLLSSVLSSSLDGIIVFSAIRNAGDTIADFECVLVNPQAEKLFESTAEDIVGMRLREDMPQQEDKGLFDAYREVVETGEPAEMEVHYDADGQDVWFQVMAVKVENGVAVTYRDITDRKEAERQIREQAQLLDKARDAILAHDLDGRIVYWNKSAERLTGWSKDEVLGAHAHDCLYAPNEEDKLQQCHETMMAEGEWTGELHMRTDDDEERIVESRWSLVRDNTGEPKHVLVINTDITERKRLESQFLRSQRMESLGRLVGGIAHDLGNLLVPITLGVKVLKRRVGDTDDKVDQTLSMIQKSADRGSDMVEQVLAFARGVEGERVALQPELIVEEVEEMTEETFPEDVEVRTRTDADLCPVVGDATQIQQVLMNLCVNARDAMPDGGTLTVDARNIDFTEREARRNIEAEPGDYVRIAVHDTGTGMPDDVADKIFEPFFTTKEEGEGTGLGLSTAYSIIQSHDGFMDVESEEGEGTTFWIYLPAADEDVTVETASTTNGEAEHERPSFDGEGTQVLVVDDEEFVLESAQQTLEVAGYEVQTALDAAAALRVMQKEAIDLVITDLRMPEMSGLDLIRRLQEQHPDLPIVAASGVADGRTEEALEAGAQTFLAKPFTAEKLEAALQEALQTSEEAAAR